MLEKKIKRRIQIRLVLPFASFSWCIFSNHTNTFPAPPYISSSSRYEQEQQQARKERSEEATKKRRTTMSVFQGRCIEFSQSSSLSSFVSKKYINDIYFSSLQIFFCLLIFFVIFYCTHFQLLILRLLFEKKSFVKFSNISPVLHREIEKNNSSRELNVDCELLWMRVENYYDISREGERWYHNKPIPHTVDRRYICW